MWRSKYMEQTSQNERLISNEGDIKEVNGVKYRYEHSGYTIREWYAHLTPGKGPGPGWDTRQGLLDDERSLAKFGRTFTEKEVYEENPPLPDTPYCTWKEIHEESTDMAK